MPCMGYQEFSTWLRALMKNKDWKNDALAKAVGVTQPTVSNWLNKKYLPDPSQTKKLAEVGGIDAWMLFEIIYDLPPINDTGDLLDHELSILLSGMSDPEKLTATELVRAYAKGLKRDKQGQKN